jgi:hypothetical protein
MLATSHRVEVPASPSLTARDRGDVKRSLPPSFPFVPFDSRHVLEVTSFTSRLPRSSVLVSLSLSPTPSHASVPALFHHPTPAALHIVRLQLPSTHPFSLELVARNTPPLREALSETLSDQSRWRNLRTSPRQTPPVQRATQHRRKTGRRCSPRGQRRSHRIRVT